jgi:hypothetical protein
VYSVPNCGEPETLGVGQSGPGKAREGFIERTAWLLEIEHCWASDVSSEARHGEQ